MNGPDPAGRGASAVVSGLGAQLPARLVPNAELATRLDTSDEWIRSRTGIAQRYVVEPGTATSDLAVEAGRRALKSAGVDSVDAVVLATTTPDHPCPATAPAVAARLGLARVAAFDIGAVCTGFIYALAAGAGLIATSVARQVLVIGADTFSTILDPHDRTTGAIFGDGAGAVVLRAGEATEPGALGPFDLGSDGEGAEMICVPAGGSRQRSTGPANAADHYFQMDGRAVFRQAVLRMAASARKAVDAAGWEVTDLHRLVMHQANTRILAALATKLGIAEDRMVSNIGSVGNTAAASIPLALFDAAVSGELEPGRPVLLGAFGGGLTWGATTLRWPDVTPV